MARIDIAGFVADFVQQNKGLSQEQLKVGLRNALQDQKRNGVKISPKEMAQANEMLSQSLVAQNVKAGINAGEKVKQSVKTMAPRQAVETYSSNLPKLSQNEYDMLQYDKGNALKERRNAFQQELQEAFGVGKNDVKAETASSHFAENKATRRMDLLDGMVDKEHQGATNFEEHLEKLSPKEKQAALEESKQVKTEPYVSTKKAKKAKKAKIKANQMKHKRYRDSKKLRNARYCTQNGFMTHDAKKAYNDVLKQANGHMHVNVNATAPIKSAEESAKVFMENGFMTHDAKKAYNDVLKQANGHMHVSVNATAPIKSAEESAKVFMENGFKPVEEAVKKGISKGGKIAIAATIFTAIASMMAIVNKNKQDEVVIEPQQSEQNIQYVA